MPARTIKEAMMNDPQILYITTPETLDALGKAKLIEGARLYRGAVVVAPTDGVQIQIINLETGEELPKGSPEQRAELDRMLQAIKSAE